MEKFTIEYLKCILVKFVMKFNWIYIIDSVYKISIKGMSKKEFQYKIVFSWIKNTLTVQGY